MAGPKHNDSPPPPAPGSGGARRASGPRGVSVVQPGHGHVLPRLPVRQGLPRRVQRLEVRRHRERDRRRGPVVARGAGSVLGRRAGRGRDRSPGAEPALPPAARPGQRPTPTPRLEPAAGRPLPSPPPPRRHRSEPAGRRDGIGRARRGGAPGRAGRRRMRRDGRAE